MLVFSRDKERLLTHFRRDPVLFCYHIGDLDDFYFDDCQWMVDYADRARIEECILVYHALETPSVLAFGLTPRFAPFLREATLLFPDRFYCHFVEGSRAILLEEYDQEPFGTHLRMVLGRFAPCPLDLSLGEPVDLDRSDLADIEALYAEAYPGSYFVPRMLDTKAYLGFRSKGRLAAIVGVHVNNDRHKIVVLGNFATHPAYRGKGIATGLASMLIERLLARGKTICLNVKKGNGPAIRSYTKLGFELAFEYEEALLVRK